MLKNDKNTVWSAELGMYPLETDKDARKLKWQYIVRNMSKKRLQTMADRAVWEKKQNGELE